MSSRVLRSKGSRCPLLQLPYGRENQRKKSRPKDVPTVADDSQPKDFRMRKQKSYDIYEGPEKEVSNPVPILRINLIFLQNVSPSAMLTISVPVRSSTLRAGTIPKAETSFSV